MTTYSPPQVVRALRIQRMTELVIEAQHLHCSTERDGAPCIYHFDSESQSLEKWAWLCLSNEHASPVPPDELEQHGRDYTFRTPCCPCAFVNGVPYTPTKINLLESVNGNKSDPLKRPFIGEYVAECATGTCGYFVVLERFYGSRAPHSPNLRHLPPARPIISLRDTMGVTCADSTPRGFRRILIPPAPSLGFSRGSLMHTVLLAGSRGEPELSECDGSSDASINTLMNEGLPEAEFWDLFIQCAECGHVVPSAQYPYFHRCAKKGKVSLGAQLTCLELKMPESDEEVRREREEEEESDRRLGNLRAAMFPRRTRARGLANQVLIHQYPSLLDVFREFDLRHILFARDLLTSSATTTTTEHSRATTFRTAWARILRRRKRESAVGTEEEEEEEEEECRIPGPRQPRSSHYEALALGHLFTPTAPLPNHFHPRTSTPTVTLVHSHISPRTMQHHTATGVHPHNHSFQQSTPQHLLPPTPADRRRERPLVSPPAHLPLLHRIRSHWRGQTAVPQINSQSSHASSSQVPVPENHDVIDVPDLHDVTDAELAVSPAQLQQELRHSKCPDASLEVIQWICQGLGVEVESLDAREALRSFSEISWSLQEGDSRNVSIVWSRLRRRVEDTLIGTGQVQQKQHNILETLTEDLEDDSGDDEGDVDGDQDFSQDCSEWEEFMELYDKRLGKGVKTSQWTAVVRSNLKLWAPLCHHLSEKLAHASKFLTCKQISSEESEDLYLAVIGVLRRLRLIPPSVYSKPSWEKSQSRLPSAILLWSDLDAFSSWTASFAILLLRKHRIDLTLLCVLYAWVPLHVLEAIAASRGATSDPPALLPLPTPSTGDELHTGTDLLRALRLHPGIVPFSAAPSSVFFLLGFHNFQEACAGWLFRGLLSKGYRTKGLCNEQGEPTPAVFNSIVTTLTLNAKEADYTKDSLLKAVFQRTVDFWDLKKQMKAKKTAEEKKTLKKLAKAAKRKAKKSRQDTPDEEKPSTEEVDQEGFQGLLGLNGRTMSGSLRTPCKLCKDLMPEEQCVQEIIVTVDPPNPFLKGCALSVHPREQVQKPSRAVPGRESALTTKPVYSPSELGLIPIACDETVVRRCGIQIFRLVDKRTGFLRDFWAYGALPENLRQKMLDHVRAFAKLKGLQRGGQFKDYIQGRMVGMGPRTASGGIEADVHRYPDIMSASDVGSLNCLFDNAEDSLILDEIARLIAPEIYDPLHAAGQGDERVGIDKGGVLYYCENFAAPLHLDKDAAPGLCANLAYKAAAGDFCFVNMVYRNAKGDRFYFQPRSNSLWSFRGTDLHGTTLPVRRCTTRGGGRGDGGEDDPYIYTLHKAKNDKNVKAAAKYAKVRAARGDVVAFWEES
ncbi:hypothetical protein NMY22_g7480 [Coprinellus aureogranulatus]|nr:hypothetical protein NMY22_g7480 [Coprinellus aureogranulatus]